MTDDVKIAETFNSFFGNTVNTLNIEKDESIFCDTGDETDPLLRAIKKYSKHPSILRIKQYFNNPTEFSFVPADKDVIAKEIKNLDTKKAVPQDDIPVKILKLNNDIFSQYLSQIFNESIEATNFPNELKYADITPVYKKSNRHEKENYRPVSIISVISKILERCLYDQIYKNIDNTLSRHQMGYRKGYSSQHSLIVMFEKWKENLNQGRECGALFVDLYKAFDCLQHDLLLAKLNAYGFDYKSLNLISSFLSNRKYRTKINSSFSEWKQRLIVVPQDI